MVPALTLILLYAVCDLLTRGLPLRRGTRPPPDRSPGDTAGAGAFFPVLFAGALMLPPSAAALAAVPGALFGHAPPPRVTRRLWNAAQLALSAFAAAAVFRLLDGPRLLLGARFPGALPRPPQRAMTFCLVNGALVERRPAAGTPPARVTRRGGRRATRTAAPQHRPAI